MKFDDAFRELLGHEGGYVDHPSDPGVLLGKRGCNRGEGLSSSQPQLDGVSTATPHSGPFSDRMLHAVHCESFGCSEIVRLLAGGRPAAVIWLVVSVHINAVKRTSRRPRPHVRKELLERVHPLSTNGDTTPTPQVVSGAARIQTPVLHRRPRLVLWCVAHAVCFVVRDLLLSMKASAGSSFARGEPRCRHVCRGAAVADAGPTPFRLAAWLDSWGGLLNDYKTGKPFADQIEGISHAV